MQETQETWVQSLSQEDPLEKKKAVYSRVLAWKMPWAEELEGCSPWGCRELDTTEHTCTHTHALVTIITVMTIVWTVY